MDLRTLGKYMIDHGVVALHAKRLAANDTSKQQIYLAGSFGLLNLLPSGKPVKRPSERGREVLHAALDLAWIGPHGELVPAPAAKLVLYPQYPEVRFSGFLRGARGARVALLDEDARTAGRYLLFGVRGDGRIIAHVVGPDEPIARELDADRESAGEGRVLRSIPLPWKDFGDEVFERLGEIARAGWLDSRRLRSDGSSVPCEAQNCGGYTLEALLGIAPNSRSEPDYLGWEIKQFAVASLDVPRARSAITLFTPEPDHGVYAESGVIEFVRRFGYADTKARAGRWNFGGAYRLGAASARTGLSLGMSGFDVTTGKVTTIDGAITLRGPDGTVAAGWSFVSLLDHWRRKHAQAVYVPSVTRVVAARQYRFGNTVFVGQGTDFGRFLSAVSQQSVYYDPGIKVVTGPGRAVDTKKRSQFRTRFAGLQRLYASFEQRWVGSRGTQASG